jgi:hypothetical protein
MFLISVMYLTLTFLEILRNMYIGLEELVKYNRPTTSLMSFKPKHFYIGRAGKSGKSITFMDRADWSHAQELIDLLEEANQDVPGESLGVTKHFYCFFYPFVSNLAKLAKMAVSYRAWKERNEAEKSADGYRGPGVRGGSSGEGCFNCGKVNGFNLLCCVTLS